MLKQTIYAIEMKNITKILNQTIIINNITMKIKKGEIHALIGENGSGKSTLMNILFGLCKITYGDIYINGNIKYIHNPIKAYKLGIGMIHQHFKLINSLNILDNIILGNEPIQWKIFINRKKAKKEINKIIHTYNFNINLNDKISHISAGTKQKIEILKILYRNANIIIFDEPTSMLTPEEIKNLLKIMIKLKNKNKTIIFITHKLNEIFNIADSATIIKNGKIISTFQIKNKTKAEICKIMFNKQKIKIKHDSKKISKKILLKIENLTIKKTNCIEQNIFKNLNITIHSGEILVITKNRGNGPSMLIDIILGIEKKIYGKIIFNNIDVTKLSLNKKYQLGMSYIPEDSHKHSLILNFNAINNLIINNIKEKPYSYYGILNKSAIKLYGQAIINKYQIKNSNNGFLQVNNLSGGNQQKLIIGRELTRKHNILIINQPTKGLDDNSIENIHEKILEEKYKGHAILLISYEIEEILHLADKVIIMNQEKIIKNISINKTKTKILYQLPT